MPSPIERDRVPRDAGLGAGQHPLLADQVVDQGRFADVGAPDDRQLQRPFGFRLDWAGFCIRIRLPLRREELQPFVEFAEALAVLRRDRHRIAEAERIGLVELSERLPPFRLVGDQHDRRAGAAQPAGEMAVQRGQPGARVDQQQREVGLR